ncbi:MAG: hypothetical protein LBL07_07990 [Tannerella sp.]|jgi:hypothetical protein|nr:hypothetical protein [Tannerella sp.]
MYYYFKKTLFLFFLPAFLGLAGCGGDDPNLENMSEQEIQALFLGEWEETERGNEEYSVLATDGHTIEFSADGIYLNSLSDVWRRYSLDSEFLYLDGGKAPDGHTYRHTFVGSRNKLRLDYVAGNRTAMKGTPTFRIYKRVK